MVHGHMSAASTNTGVGGAGSSTVAGDFNPYNDAASTSGSLKSSQSMPEPMLESHFNAGRPTFHQQQQAPPTQQQQQQQTSPSAFHASHQQGFSQLNLGNYRQSNPGGGFVSRNTPPTHDQFFNSNEEINGTACCFYWSLHDIILTRFSYSGAKHACWQPIHQRYYSIRSSSRTAIVLYFE